MKSLNTYTATLLQLDAALQQSAMPGILDTLDMPLVEFLKLISLAGVELTARRVVVADPIDGTEKPSFFTPPASDNSMTDFTVHETQHCQGVAGFTDNNLTGECPTVSKGLLDNFKWEK